MKILPSKVRSFVLMLTVFLFSKNWVIGKQHIVYMIDPQTTLFIISQNFCDLYLLHWVLVPIVFYKGGLITFKNLQYRTLISFVIDDKLCGRIIHHCSSLINIQEISFYLRRLRNFMLWIFIIKHFTYIFLGSSFVTTS